MREYNSPIRHQNILHRHSELQQKFTQTWYQVDKSWFQHNPVVNKGDTLGTDQVLHQTARWKGYYSQIVFSELISGVPQLNQTVINPPKQSYHIGPTLQYILYFVKSSACSEQKYYPTPETIQELIHTKWFLWTQLSSLASIEILILGKNLQPHISRGASKNIQTNKRTKDNLLSILGFMEVTKAFLIYEITFCSLVFISTKANTYNQCHGS